MLNDVQSFFHRPISGSKLFTLFILKHIIAGVIWNIFISFLIILKIELFMMQISIV